MWCPIQSQARYPAGHAPLQRRLELARASIVQLITPFVAEAAARACVPLVLERLVPCKLGISQMPGWLVARVVLIPAFVMADSRIRCKRGCRRMRVHVGWREVCAPIGA